MKVQHSASAKPCQRGRGRWRTDRRPTELLAALSTAALAAVESGPATPPQTQPSEITDTDGPVLISVPEAARILGLSRASAYRYATAGALPVKRFGRRVYVIPARLAEVTIPDSTVAQQEDNAA